MRWPGAFVALILIVGIAGSAIALASREGNAEFTAQQRALGPVHASALAELIATTSDPRPGYAGRARAARCSSGGATALGNPWTCVVRYPRLPRVRYLVTVFADRSIDGAGQPEGRPLGGPLKVSGCCVGAS
jgi:hypothetical protein